MAARDAGEPGDDPDAGAGTIDTTIQTGETEVGSGETASTILASAIPYPDPDQGAEPDRVADSTRT